MLRLRETERRLVRFRALAPLAALAVTSSTGCAPPAFGSGVFDSPHAAAPVRAPQPSTPSAVRSVNDEARRDRPLSEEEQRALASGRTVRRPFIVERDGRRYIGGVCYQRVDVPPERVLHHLYSVEAVPEWLPDTRSADLEAEDKKGLNIRLVQGEGVYRVAYSLRVERKQDDALFFWLDNKRAHDVRDVWGAFRVAPMNDKKSSLITVTVALDLGPTLLRMVFEEEIHETILHIPGDIRRFVERQERVSRGVELRKSYGASRAVSVPQTSILRASASVAASLPD